MQSNRFVVNIFYMQRVLFCFISKNGMNLDQNKTLKMRCQARWNSFNERRSLVKDRQMKKESPKLYDFRVGVDRISSVSGRSVHKNGSFDWMIVKIGDKNALIVRSHIELRKPGGTVVKCFFFFQFNRRY